MNDVDVQSSIDAMDTTGVAGEEPASIDVPGLPEPDGAMHKASAFRSLLAPFRAGRLLDIDAEKPNFPVTAAHLGWQVTALNTRTPVDADAAEDAPEVAALADTISWQSTNVAEFPISRDDFDMVIIHDLNHRLSLEEQLTLVRRCAGMPLIIDARLASGRVIDTGRYQGRSLAQDGDDGKNAEAAPTPEPAFMHTEESLVRLLRDCGFPMVMMARPPHRQDAALYLALPRNWDAPTQGKRSDKRMARRDGINRERPRNRD